MKGTLSKYLAPEELQRIATRIKLLRKSKNCRYCKKRLTQHNATIDHYTPRDAGGSDDLSNLQPACISCNRAKRNLPPEQFQKMISDRRAVQKWRKSG